MFRRLVMGFVLVVGLLLSSRGVFADPPDPIKADIHVTPQMVHVGDTVTIRCQVVPLRGATLDTAQMVIHWGEVSEVGPELWEKRTWPAHGPQLWGWTLSTSRPGTFTAECTGSLYFQGVLYSVAVSEQVEVLP